MKSPSIPPLPVAFAVFVLGSLLAGTRAPAQLPDSFIPEMDPVGTERKEDTREKTYVQKTALRWELSRRYSEHVFEEYLPKFEAIVKKGTPETSDWPAWRSLGGQFFTSWEESRKHEKTGTTPSDQRTWEDEHLHLLGEIAKGGAALVFWRDGVATHAGLLRKEADEAPGRFAEIRKSMAITDPIWTKAIELASGASGASWNREKLKEAQDAYADLKGKRDLFESTYGAIRSAYEYATKDQARKPSLDRDPDEKAILDRWKQAVSKHALVQKIYAQPVQEWAKVLEGWSETDGKAWDAMQKAFEPVKKGEIRASSPYKDCPWEKKVAECVQKTLDDLATAIAAAGRKVEGAEAKVLEDKAATEKEYRRLLELYRLAGPREEYLLQKEIDSASTDTDRSRAEKKLQEYRSSLKSAEAEAGKIRAEHRARRKALGIPPEDWAE